MSEELDILLDGRGLEFFESGDGVEYEIWVDWDNKQLYKVPIEIKRYFDQAEKINSIFEAKFGKNERARK